MNGSLKRFLSLVLAFVMVLSCVPVNAFASEVCEHAGGVTITSTATCTEAGELVTTCNTCGETISTETAEATGHNFVEGICTVCEEVEIPAEPVNEDSDVEDSNVEESNEEASNAEDSNAEASDALELNAVDLKEELLDAEGSEEEQLSAVMIENQGYATLSDALTAASAMTGNVEVWILDKVTLNSSLSGSFDSIKFMGMAADAEIYLDVQGYITATGKKVAFEDLTLSKSAGGFITNAGFMNVAFGVYDVAEVTYTRCTFANGAYASSGKVTFTGCTFKRSHDKYGLWAYGDVETIVEGCTFAEYRGIKMYAEGAAKTVDLTVKNTDFSAVDNKPAIVLTYGESVTLEGNTYSSKGTFELDLDGAPNGTAVTSDVPPTCVNDNGDCGVLVDGKIYTTVAQAAEVATSGSTVTLLHNSTETVVLPEGVKLEKNGFDATGVTVVEPAVPAAVAQIGDTEYTTLQAAVNVGGNITLLDSVTEDIQIPDNATVVLDLNTKTLNGYIAPFEGDLTVKNGAIVNNDGSKSAIEITAGELKLVDVNVTSARHAVRIDGAVTAVIDGGEYKPNATSGTRHAVNVSGAANVTIKSGEFVGPAGTTMDSGSAVCVQAGATVTIEGGNFSKGKNSTLGVSGTMTVTGGTFDQDPSAYLSDGYAALPNLDGKFVVGTDPTATVKNLGEMTVPANAYYIYNGSLTTGTVDMPLNFVMQFIADQDEEDMETSPFADWYADFVITFEGIEGGSFVPTGCYLAGYYGSTDSWDGMWVKIPVEGVLNTVDEGTRYPVMMGVGMPQTYDYICSGVQAFSCAMYIPEAILEANPNLKVNLELNVVDSSDDNKALEALQTGKNIYKVSDTSYTAEDFVSKTYVAQIGETKYETLADALTEAADGATIELIWAEGDAPIAMNGAVYGKSVTITGTAQVDWSKGWLFVGRGGEGNGTVIFDDANLTSASNSATYGIHVSGREKGTDNKYDGTLVIKDSTIELDYLINRGAIEVDNSTFTVKNGFGIAGRPSTETESGEAATATIDIKNNSYVKVLTHNGMGVGVASNVKEGNGILNLTDSTFECASFNVDKELGDFNVYGESTVNIATLSGKEINLQNGAIVKDSTVGGHVLVLGKVTFRGDNTVALIEDYGDAYSSASADWTVEAGASLTMTEKARWGLGYGDKATILGNIEDALNARETLTEDDLSLFTHGVVAMSSWAAGGDLTVKDAYVVIGQNNSLGNTSKSGYKGSYNFKFENAVLDSSRITFYEAGSTTNFEAIKSDMQVGTFMTRDADSVFTLTNTKLVSTTTTNGNDEGNYHAGTLVLNNSELTYSAPLVMENGSLTVGAGSSLTAPSITGTGKIVIDASGLRAGDEPIKGDASGYTGTIEVTGNDALKAEIDENGNIVLAEKPAPVAQALNAAGEVVGSYYDFETALAAACGDTNISRIEILSDIEQNAIVNTNYNDITHALTIGVPEGETHTVTINVTGDSIAVRVMGEGASLTIEKNLIIEGLDVVANGFATNNENMIIDGTVKALSLKQWTNNGTITVSETGKVWLGYGDGQLDLAYGNGTVTVNGTLDSTADLTGLEPQFKAGYSGTRGNGNTLNLKDTYFEGGAWFNVNGSNGTFNLENSVMKVSGGDGAGKLDIASSGNKFNLTNGSRLLVANLIIGAENTVNIDSTSTIESTTITGAGSIVIDAANMTDGVQVITADMSGFTGTISVINNDAASAKITETGVVIESPKGDNFTGYTGTDGIWGEVWGNAKESYVVKVLDANGNVMGTTSLNNIDGIIDGDVKVTWNIKLDAASNTDPYWIMSWTTAPTVDNMPAKVELWIDGVKVSGGDVVLNGPDNLNVINAIVADADGKILSYQTTLAKAVDAAETGATIVLRAGNHEMCVFQDKELTFVGEDKATTFVTDYVAKGSQMHGAKVHFENLTVNGRTGKGDNANYYGLFHAAEVTYKNCNITGIRFLYATKVSFEECAFTTSGEEHSFWTYGASEITVTNCTFAYADRAVNCYSESVADHTTAIAFSGCTFTYTGSDENHEGAVEINSGLIKNITVSLDECKAINEKNIWFNSQWDTNKGANTVVEVDDVQVWPVYVAKIGDKGYTTLQDALNAAAAGTGNVTVEILADINLTDVDWAPVSVSASGYPLVTVNGNNKTITGLNDMLFSGTWAGGSGLIINDLTIKDSTIVNDKDDSEGTVGVGAFVGFPQASATITLKNCHLVNSSVEGGHWTGGLVGYAAGYAGTDGPVFMNLTIDGCSVTGSTITGKGSVGGVIGHGSGNGWTKVTITNTTVSGNTITSTGSSTNKAGAVMGTIGAAGQDTTVNGVTKTGGAFVAATVSGNTVTSNGTTITTIYGRQGTGTGTLEITGGIYENYPIEEGASYAYPTEGYVIVQNNDGTYGIQVDPAYGKVAKIGDNYYETLAAAITAAQANDTITLLTAITEDVTVNKSLIIDGANNTYTGNMTLKANTTIKNVNFDGKGYNGYAVETRGADYLTIEDCTAKNYGYGFVQLASATVKTTVKNVTISDMNYGVKVDYSNEVVLEDLEIDAAVAAVLNSNYGSKTITIRNCDLSILGTWTRNDTIKSTYVFEGENSIDEFVIDAAIDVFKLAVGATLTAPKDITATAVDGAYSVKYENGVYKVAPVAYVAQIGEVKYESLQAAINAAQDNDIIILLTDINIADVDVSTLDGKYNTLFTVAGKTVTVNLNEKKISGAYSGDSMLVGVFSTEDNGHLTLTGNGTIDITATNTVYGLLVNYDSTSTLTVENGTYTLDKASDSLIYSGAGETVTVKGGTFTLENVGTGSNGSPWIFNVKGSGDYPVTVTGGTFNANIQRQYWVNEVLVPTTHYVQDNGNGTWTVKEGATLYAIEGALTGPYYVEDWSIGYPSLEAFIAAVKNDTTNGNTIDLEDRLVLFNEPSTYKAEGYKLVENEDGTWNVVEYAEPVAKIGDVEYSSLQAAINAAKDNDIITLLTDINLADAELQALDGSYNTYFLVEGKTVTIDLAGKTISGAYTGDSMLVGVFSTDKNGHLTLTGNGTVDVTATSTVYSLIVSYSDGTGITIENGTYKLDKASDNLVYYGGYTDAAVTVKGGSFTLGNVGTGENGKPWIFNVLGAGDHHVYITGGSFNADINRQHWSNEAVVSKECYVVEENGIWTVKEGAVAYVNTGMVTGPYFAPKDIGYATFAEAVKEAVDKDDLNVTLLKDNAESVEIAKGITLDVNGKNYTGTITLTDAGATLTAADGLNVVTSVDGSKVVYENGVYKVAPVVYVAQIGETKYKSLQEAIEKAENEDEIILLENIDLAKTDLQTLDGYDTYFLVEGKTVTINLNEKTISGAYTGESMLVGVFSTDKNGHLTLTGNGIVDVTATSTVYSLIVCYNDGSTITIENGTYKLDKAYDNLVYYGGYTDAAVTVKGGTFTLGNVGTGENGKPWIFNVLGAGDHHVYITGGTFNADINHQHWSNEAVVSKECYVVEENGIWTVKKGAVAYVNTGMVTGPYFAPKDVGYKTLEEAVAAADELDDKNVTLLKDVTLTETIKVNNNIILDLNGHVIFGTCGASQGHLFMVANAAKLTIKDSSAEETGKITYEGNNSTGWIVDVEGDLVLESGTLELTGTWNIGYAVDVRPNAWGTAYTAPTTFTMNGGKIVSSDGAVRVASSSADSYKDVSAAFTMNGGSIDAAWDGVFIQQSNAAWDKLSFTMTGGTIESDLNPIRLYGPAATSYVNDEDCVSISLKGGALSYTGNKTSEWLVDGMIRIGGGATAAEFVKDTAITASAEFAQANVAEGFKWAENADGTYTLTEATYVAQIGEVKYESLQDAVNAGGEITVLTDIVLDAPITVAADKNVTLDLNGKTVSYTSDVLGTLMITNHGDLTITDGVGEGKITYCYTGESDQNTKTNATIENFGKLTVASGIVENTTDVKPLASYAIDTREGATLTVAGGKVLNLNGHAIRQVSFGTAANTVNITGGYIEGTRALQVQLPGSAGAAAPEMTLNISGGELKSNEDTYNLAVYVYSNGQTAEKVAINITGGTLNGNVAINATATNSMAAKAVKVTGGTFNGDYGIFTYADADTNNTIAITGGTYKTNYSEMYATDDGYVFVENDGKYTVEEVKLFAIKSSNIVLGNELAMYFYVSNDDLDGTDYIAEVTKTYVDATPDKVVEIPFSNWENTSNNRKRFRFDGIAAKEMGDDITVVIKNSNGAILTEAYTDSIQKYVERGFAAGKATGELATLLVDMLNYGAAAQGINKYNQAHPANENMANYQHFATQSVTLENKQVKGKGFKSMSLVLESNISMVMFFDKSYVNRNMTAVVTFTDHLGEAHTIEIPGSEFEDRGSKGWAIIINELVVADGRQLVTCKFKDASGNEVDGVYGIDSMESMCARAVAGGGGSYYEDIMKFSSAAYNYFH